MGGLIASLNMYDWPPLEAANRDFWQALRPLLIAQGLDAPQALSQDRHGFDLWRDPSLLLGQTCGYPYWATLREAVTLVATPCYDVPGCQGPYYRSVFLTSRSSGVTCLWDAVGRRALASADHSMSGYIQLADSFAAWGGLGAFSSLDFTGSHRNSMLALAGGQAEIAAIDCVSWYWAQRSMPEVTDQLRLVDYSRLAPGLPLVTAFPHAKGSLRLALTQLAEDQLAGQAVCQALRITGFSPLESNDYACLADFKRG